jgi:hypothetical protein
MTAKAIRQRLLDFIQTHDAHSREEQHDREREMVADRDSRIAEERGFRRGLGLVRQEIENIRDW